ncbi:unnamed protein product, partial [Rotaria magnacalcarata]
SVRCSIVGFEIVEVLVAFAIGMRSTCVVSTVDSEEIIGLFATVRPLVGISTGGGIGA